MGNGARASAVLEDRVARETPPGRSRLQRLCTIAGFDACVLTRTRHDGIADLLVEQVLALDRATMLRLGDAAEAIELDIAETIGCSTFLLLVGCPPARPHRPELVGAVRLMLGAEDGVKTLWDVDRRSAGRRGPRHPWMTDPTQLVDVMAFSPAPDTGLGTAAVADLLMAACTCAGAALLHSGRASYLTADVHQRFHRHVTRIGYPLRRFVPDEHPANEVFFPVVASLEAIDHLVRSAPAGTHLGDLRGEYLRVAGAAVSLGTADW